jgi:selenophosphate synthetase-related protein
MLAEASGCGAELDMAALPRPPGAGMADWLTCFPGFALVVAGPVPDVSTAAPATVARCGRLVAGTGVYLRWPDGELTPAVDGPVVGLGPASGARPGGPR